MVRITAELLSQYAEQRTNPLGDRELVLRDWGIPAIENMGIVAVRNDFDCIDFTNNRLTRLDNFPRMIRVVKLQCSNNLIDTIDAKNIQKNLPNIRELTLSNNNVHSLSEVINISQACPNLEFLSLTGNPVTRRQHYRLYAIHRLPNLKVLDYQKVKPAERKRAERLASSAAGAALESDVQIEAAQRQRDYHGGAVVNGVKTFEPGEGLPPDDDDVDNHNAAVVAKAFTPEEKQQIRELLANASSAKEIEDIENSVKRGILPAAIAARNKRKREEEEEEQQRQSAESNGKEDADEIPVAKRIQT